MSVQRREMKLLEIEYFQFALLCVLLLTVSGLSGQKNNVEPFVAEAESGGEFSVAGADISQALCSACRRVVNVVDQVLLLNSTKENIFQGATSKLCKFVPDSEQTACELVTRQTHPMIFKCAMHYLDTPTLCSDARISLCPSPTLNSTVFSATNKHECQVGTLRRDDILCAGCEFSIGALQLYLNHSAAQLVRALQRDICVVHFNDGQDEAVCMEMLTMFGPALLKVAVSRIDAAGICCQTGVC